MLLLFDFYIYVYLYPYASLKEVRIHSKQQCKVKDKDTKVQEGTKGEESNLKESNGKNQRVDKIKFITI